MVGNERHDPFDQAGGRPDIGEEGPGGRFSFGLMVPARDSRSRNVGRGRLSQIVAERTEQDDERRIALETEPGYGSRGLVQSEQRMRPDVSFRMPMRILRGVFEKVQLRMESGDESYGLRRDESKGRLVRLQQELLPFFPNPFLGKFPKRFEHRIHERRAFGFDRQSEPRNELQRAVDPERIVGERPCVRNPENSGIDVGNSSKRVVEALLENVEGDRIQGEIPSSESVYDAHAGVGLHAEAAVSRSGFRIPSRQRDVDFRTAPDEFEDSERFSDFEHAAETRNDRLYSGIRKVVDFQVEILRGNAEKRVPRGSSDEIGDAALRIGSPGNGKDDRKRLG